MYLILYTQNWNYITDVMLVDRLCHASTNASHKILTWTFFSYILHTYYRGVHKIYLIGFWYIKKAFLEIVHYIAHCTAGSDIIFIQIYMEAPTGVPSSDFF